MRAGRDEEKRVVLVWLPDFVLVQYLLVVPPVCEFQTLQSRRNALGVVCLSDEARREDEHGIVRVHAGHAVISALIDKN